MVRAVGHHPPQLLHIRAGRGFQGTVEGVDVVVDHRRQPEDLLLTGQVDGDVTIVDDVAAEAMDAHERRRPPSLDGHYG